MDVGIIDLLDQIRDSKGNDKLIVMENHPELKDVMEWAYNPFKKYYISAPENVVADNTHIVCCNPSTGHLMPGATEILLRLTCRTLSGNEAINTVTTYCEMLTESSCKLFKQILNKDLRLGIHIRSINKVWPGLIPGTEDGQEKPKVMFVMNFNPKKMTYPRLVAPKLDGVRGRFFEGQMYSRQGKIIQGLYHIIEALDPIGPDFDGEIMVPGNQFDSASGLIRNLSPVPDATFNLFDHGADPLATKIERLAFLRTMEKFMKEPCIQFIQHEWVNTEDQLLFKYHEYLGQGHEGIIIYDPKSLYEDKRSTDWMRIVPLKRADCRVIGFYEGKGKLVGSLGGIIVDYKGHDVRVGSGFAEKDWKDLTISKRSKSDEKVYIDTIRSYIWDRQDQFMGMIAECQFKEETKAGSMRQPSFKGWRYDKTEPNWE